MKKILIVGLIATSSLFGEYGTNCDNLLKEADKYLSRVALCEVTAEKHATIALAYYKRYEICINYLRTNFQINPLVDEEPFKCENHKKKE
jgi:hypothetical protein